MEIKCNNTGKEFTREYDIESENDFKKYIGKVFDSKSCGKWVCLGVGGRNKHSNKLYIVYNLKTGTVRMYRGGAINTGVLKDYYYPCVCGVGYMGSIKHANNISNHYLYKRWYNMLRRCYDKNNEDYKYYGGKGVFVHDKWFNFSNFANDCKGLNGYNKTKIINNDLVLDKDFYYIANKELRNSSKVYSRETCRFITQKRNLSLKSMSCDNKYIKDNKKQAPNVVRYKNISGNIRDNQSLFCVYNKNIKLYHYNQAELCEIFDFSTTCVSRCLRDDWRKHKGFKFKYIKEFPDGWTVENCSDKCIGSYSEYLDNKK
jgi:hypothetical protein